VNIKDLKSNRPQTITTRRHFLGSMAKGAASLGLSAMMSEPAGSLQASEQFGRSTGKQPTALVFDDISKSHVPGVNRPECPERYDAILKCLTKSDFNSKLMPFKARRATDGEILACHTDAYLALIAGEINHGVKKLSTGDTYVCRDSLNAAYYTAGAACVGIDAVLGGQAKNAFCLTRPPGHHATASRAMGFCIFNNAGIAARYAQRKYGVGKVLIVDWDVHHGNGTQDIFYEDGSVFYFSTHESPWYPWTGSKEETGRSKGLGTTLNCPLARGASRKEFISAFGLLASAADRFKPDLVIISAGFDSRHGDPLGQFELTDDNYKELTGIVLEIARHHTESRVVSLLEGGYNLTGLASAATAHCERLQQG
jgi:acetoin utilization deacetylase AcuC-like enzyme